MTQDEARARLEGMNHAQIARDTKLDPMWISRFFTKKIRYPRENFQVLVEYLEKHQERRA